MPLRCRHHPQPKANQVIDLATARRIISAAEGRASDLGQPMQIAVVDAGGNIVSHVRMDGAWLGSAAIALDKAYTARAFDMPTKDLAGMSQSGGPLFGINSTNSGRIVVFPGGIPLVEGGSVVGGVGVSGGTPDQDQEVAEAGAAVLG